MKKSSEMAPKGTIQLCATQKGGSFNLGHPGAIAGHPESESRTLKTLQARFNRRIRICTKNSLKNKWFRAYPAWSRKGPDKIRSLEGMNEGGGNE